MESDCVFCKIIGGTIPADKVVETENILVIKDHAPKAEIHYLIIPKEHYKDLNELDDCCLSSDFFDIARDLSFQDTKAKDYRLLVNNGFGAGQRVFHLHFHFLAGSHLAEF